MSACGNSEWISLTWFSLYPEPLWDGQVCVPTNAIPLTLPHGSAYNFPNDNIEVRICGDHDEDVTVCCTTRSFATP